MIKNNRKDKKIIIISIRMNYYTSLNYLFLASKPQNLSSSYLRNILINCPLLFASSCFLFFFSLILPSPLFFFILAPYHYALLLITASSHPFLVPLFPLFPHLFYSFSLFCVFLPTPLFLPSFSLFCFFPTLSPLQPSFSFFPLSL